jgi:putative pyruvate formate lyase activating enzyme
MEKPKLDALKRYFSILQRKQRPNFKIAKEKDLLENKIAKAFKLLKACKLCERRCGVDRHKALGFCGIPAKMLVSSYFVHLGEEPFFVPSFTIFFYGCNFRCVFCQNYAISQRLEKAMEMSEKELAKVIDSHSHCRNINLVGGEPTPYLPFILKTLSYVKADMPVIWNSNFYMSKEAMNLLEGIVDVYLSDFKYGNDECAARLSGVENYIKVVERNHKDAARQKQAGIVIRHLVMPNHVECCSKPVLEWIAKNCKKAIVNIMDQYRPEFRAFEYGIDRRISQAEFNEVIKHARSLGLNFIC